MYQESFSILFYLNKTSKNKQGVSGGVLELGSNIQATHRSNGSSHIIIPSMNINNPTYPSILLVQSQKAHPNIIIDSASPI